MILKPDPIRLEIFSNLFQFIAEEMGITLQKTAASVNIKERLDFSCAIFDADGYLVANAPHIPVHLGSMAASIQGLKKHLAQAIAPETVYLTNNPYQGGTHLPDITCITPIFDAEQTEPLFYVSSRGHHSDIGGITPGSMPAHSQTITEEGVLIDSFPIVRDGILQDQPFLALLQNHPYPARNPQQNLADVIAQINANYCGGQELQRIVQQYGLETVQNYMKFVQDNAEKAIRAVIPGLPSGAFRYALDNGAIIQVKITIDAAQASALIDFTGTSPQLTQNFNAPIAVCQSAVLYVFRTLVKEAIPLNQGVLRPLQIVVPQGCLLNPVYPAAVVAGNVETSQAIVDTLYGALGILAASQGTMNNLTFGNETYQYYETICGGSWAGPTFAGTDAVQTHMTNSRLTDPEVLESHFPVLLTEFAIRENSGGKGQFPGGHGVRRCLQFQEKMAVSLLSNHRRIAPFGLAGGEPGQVGINRIKYPDGQEKILDSTASVILEPGDQLMIETPGGGGYGHVTEEP
ncbi:MAG: hydantoinase B/oxoprolinase family protein [Microcystaceae cyanobacterium]